jgi:hypothetical protein
MVDRKPLAFLALQQPLKYSNKAKVQYIVGTMLSDAVKYVN